MKKKDDMNYEDELFVDFGTSDIPTGVLWKSLLIPK